MSLPRPNGSYLNHVYLGAGRASVVPDLLADLGIERPLVVTDRWLVAEGFVDRLGLDDPAVFDAVETNPTEAMVHAGVDAFREHDCDGTVAVGGGSPIDVAKAVGILVEHPPPLADYAIVNDGVERITRSLPPIVAVPTTAGSGSEVGRAALVTVASGEKLGFLGEELLPRAAVCDPELTAPMPPALTAGTGMDALSHCVETFCSPRENPTADALALDGLERGYRAITLAVEEGTDLDARRDMMVCSLHGGLAFQKGLGAVHSLSHPLGALDDVELHHGTLNAVFLPHVLRFNAEACPEKFGTVAERIGLDDPAALPDAVSELNRTLGLPESLHEMGVDFDALEPLVPKAVNDHCTPTNPRPLNEDDARSLYVAAWEG